MTTALLEYFVDDDRVVLLILTERATAPHVFVLRSAVHDVPLGRAMLADRALRLGIDVNGLPPGWDAEPHSEARYLRALRVPPRVNAIRRTGPILRRKLDSATVNYSFAYVTELGPHLLPPAARALLAGCDLLCFVPHGPLHGLPFGLLEWEHATPLIDVFGVCQVPSAGLLPLLARRRAARVPVPPGRGLVVGCDVADDAGTESLEGAATALGDVLRGGGFDVDELVGMRACGPATRPAIGAEVGGRTVVHFACHGAFTESGGADPMLDCGVLVADGAGRPQLGAHGSPGALLSGRDVLRMAMAADLVSLQSCSAGRATTAPGDEQLGLVRAFLYAGACSLVVGLWDVNRASSQLLLRRFYEHWMGGLVKWQALRAAQRDVRADVRYRHPFHWAGFVLVGDGR
jgi:hypothetical protein